MATWESLLSQPGEEVVAPWVGGRFFTRGDRVYDITGKWPPEYGWCRFAITGGRKATFIAPTEIDPEYRVNHPDSLFRGYLVGNRFIKDGARVTTPDKFAQETQRVYLVEEGLERVARAVVSLTFGNGLVFLRTEFGLGPEEAVIQTYQDRKTSLDDIPGVTPALDLAFRWMTRQRDIEEERERRREVERLRRVEEEDRKVRMEAAFKAAGTGQGRRELAVHDFKAAAKAALMLSGAELLDTRNLGQDRVEVSYRFRRERLACIVDRRTLQVVDAGVCLTAHGDDDDFEGGEKGDTYFTLESLPGVIGQAMDEHKLVIWRHG